MAIPIEKNNSAHARAAVKRCCAAWQRAYNTTYANSKREHYGALQDASEAAHTAYCNAMPLLADYDGIRAFMACLSHGILIGAVPLEKCGQLSYAAQFALSTVQRAPKPAKEAPKTASKKVQKAA